jgi:hypothetical protein
VKVGTDGRDRRGGKVGRAGRSEGLERLEGWKGQGREGRAGPDGREGLDRRKGAETREGPPGSSDAWLGSSAVGAHRRAAQAITESTPAQSIPLHQTPAPSALPFFPSLPPFRLSCVANSHRAIFVRFCWSRDTLSGFNPSTRSGLSVSIRGNSQEVRCPAHLRGCSRQGSGDNGPTTPSRDHYRFIG